MPPWKNGAFWADWTFGFCRSKFRGAFILLFCFQGGLKNAVIKSGGHFLSSQIFQGGFFRIKNSSGAQQKKNQGGLHHISENSGGPIFITCPDQKRPPWILEGFYCGILDALASLDLILVNMSSFLSTFGNLWICFLSHKQHLKAFRNALPSCVS